MLTIERLGKSFQGKSAVSDVSLDIVHGTFVGVIGRSGAGKSTLLRCINRLVDPSEGRILFDGLDVTALRGRALRDWRSSCGMIFQQFNLAGRLDVLTNVLMGRINSMPTLPALIKLWPDGEKLNALRALDRFDLGDFAAQRAESLSGGQQQRVAIARALVTDPLLVIADEPTGDLDRQSAADILKLLDRLNVELGKSIVMVTHDPRAAEAAHHLIYLDKGQLTDTAPAH